MGDFDTLNKPSNTELYYNREYNIENGGEIPPIRIIDGRDYIANIDLSGVSVKDKIVLNDYGVFETPFDNDIRMTTGGKCKYSSEG